ncbi:hypothetical protein [Psychromonas sp. Urea-02u-13]|uniref:hypothetical protein n=1 Tax=Psychromonas sp. Urea-02u-13 TaxID=2058326 RepID=UPI000C32C11A|nr:hypothetical protein [Psychromonas sp. Urea-02u-13]PKG39537.1 hypothetical protein CXF74_07685 [Psychromonas sp. Urea-02u-13]
MRVSDTQFNNVMLNGMAESKKKLTTLMEQLHAAEKLTKISDDPVASVKLLGLEKTLNETTQYITNIESIKSEYQRYETQISSIESNLQDANALILLAKNNTADSSSFVIELESLKENFIATFNSKDNYGAYLFAGTASNEVPFIKDVATGEWAVNPNINSDTSEAVVGEGLKLTNNFTLDDVDAKDILDFMSTTIIQLNSANPDMDAVGKAHDQLLNSLGNVSASHAKLGSGINNMDRLQETHIDTELFATKLEGDLKNLNFDEAAVKVDSYSLALQVSQKTFIKLSGLSMFKLM